MAMSSNGRALYAFLEKGLPSDAHVGGLVSSCGEALGGLIARTLVARSVRSRLSGERGGRYLGSLLAGVVDDVDQPVGALAAGVVVWAAAASRWRRRMVTNWGPVS